MDSLPTALDLDQNLEIPVKIGNREFKLTQQSWPTLKRIVHYINTDGETDGVKVAVDADEDETAVMTRNYEQAVPILALIFGYEQDDTSKEEIVEFLKLHLTPAKALKIFQTWWKLNEVEDFFNRGGKTLMHPDVADAIKIHRAKFLNEDISS